MNGTTENRKLSTEDKETVKLKTEYRLHCSFLIKGRMIILKHKYSEAKHTELEIDFQQCSQFSKIANALNSAEYHLK